MAKGRRRPSLRRLHADSLEPGVVWGPLYCLPPGSQAEKRHGPRCRIKGRWISALLASRLLYLQVVINDPQKSKPQRLARTRWTMAGRAKLWRYNDFPF